MANSYILLLNFLIVQSIFRPTHGNIVPRSCEEVLRHFGGGAFSAGVYTIDPDGPGGQPPFQVTCTTSKDLPGHGITLVSHQSASQPKWFHHSSTFIVPVDFTYKPTMAQLESLIKVSRNCRQFVKVLCYHSHQFYKPHWWFSRQGLAMSNWGGAPTNSFMCACGVQGHCDDPGKPCNCLLNDKVWRSDEGYLEDKRYLPVTRVYVRDTDNNYPEEAYLTVKGLECYGEINKGHSTERCQCSLHAEENSTTPGPLLWQLPDIIYGQGQSDVWLEDGTKTTKITDVYPQFFNTKKRRQIPPVTQVTPGLSPQCVNALQRCPVDCERLAKLRFANTKLTDTNLFNNMGKSYGQCMCEKAAVKLAPPGRRIVAFYQVAPPCGFAQSSTYAFPDTTVLCCEVLNIFGQTLIIFDAQCSGINPGSWGPLLG